ncbi:calcium-binding ef-hand protein [Ophiostoma piceae UAMH 11346]|uniref:Calcium-binding ef-hand protein n=1 Tax=Ophiostoma piceae (strain UAMH 11346) TaxID=1262450 RepID=S3BSM8_OPHP1|nr:calcium-binding ef-hand protein [Ophiostoma piceae UAMH 11346]
MPSSYKPSPLGYGSPRSSPFRRPESPVSPSPVRQTPNASPFKTPGTPGASAAMPVTTPTPTSRYGGGLGGASSHNNTPVPTNGSWTPRNTQSHLQPAAEIGSDFAPSSNARSTGATGSSSFALQGSALSQLQPAQVRTLREGFQILDRDSDGTVGRDDVADMLNQLGLPSTAADVSQFFPPGGAQTINMGSFLNSLASSLATLSPSAELLSALSAFDEDDNGEIDAAELRDALLHTAPDPGETALSEAEINRVMQGFMGRRAFTKNSSGKSAFGAASAGRTEVFKYQDLVHSIAGSGQGGPDEGKEE